MKRQKGDSKGPRGECQTTLSINLWDFEYLVDCIRNSKNTDASSRFHDIDSELWSERTGEDPLYPNGGQLVLVWDLLLIRLRVFQKALTKDSRKGLQSVRAAILYRTYSDRGWWVLVAHVQQILWILWKVRNRAQVSWSERSRVERSPETYVIKML